MGSIIGRISKWIHSVYGYSLYESLECYADGTEGVLKLLYFYIKCWEEEDEYRTMIRRFQDLDIESSHADVDSIGAVSVINQIASCDPDFVSRALKLNSDLVNIEWDGRFEIYLKNRREVIDEGLVSYVHFAKRSILGLMPSYHLNNDPERLRVDEILDRIFSELKNQIGSELVRSLQWFNRTESLVSTQQASKLMSDVFKRIFNSKMKTSDNLSTNTLDKIKYEKLDRKLYRLYCDYINGVIYFSSDGIEIPRAFHDHIIDVMCGDVELDIETRKNLLAIL